MVWNLFPFKGDLSFGKRQKSQGTKCGPYRSWVTWMIWCFAKNLCTRHDGWEVWCGAEAINHHWPIAAAFWIIQIVSTEECSSLMQNLIQIHCATHSVILNMVATQYTCSLNSIYYSHWLVQWSCHCSHMHIPVHSLWLPGYMCKHSCYINNGWTFSRQNIYISQWNAKEIHIYVCIYVYLTSTYKNSK